VKARLSKEYELAEREPRAQETDANENPRYSPTAVPTRRSCATRQQGKADKRSGCPERCAPPG